MGRRIDTDDLMEEIAKIQDLRTLSTKTIGEAIDRTPTIEPERARGKWIDEQEEHKCFTCEHCVPHSSIDGTCTEYDCRFWKGATRRDGACHEWLNKATVKQ